MAISATMMPYSTAVAPSCWRMRSMVCLIRIP
jgi:hypothetical protein